MFLMEAKQRVTFTMFALCLMVCNGFASSKTQLKQVKLLIGRNSKNSICDTYRVVMANQTYTLIADGYEVRPPCNVFFTGIIKHNKTYTNKKVRYHITDVKVPCGVNNKIHISEWKVGVFANTTSKYLNLTDTLPSRETTYYCDTVLADNTSIFNYPSVLQISMYVSMPKYNVVPSVTFNAYIRDYYDRSGSWTTYSGYSKKSNYSAVICNCHGSHPQCQQCKMLAKLLNNQQDKEKDEVDSTEQKPLDINNIITVAGGIVTSLFIPVVLLLVRNYARQKRPTENENSANSSNDKNDEECDNSEDEAADEELASTINL